MNLRNISWAMGLVLLGSVAMPSLARKKKVQPVQKPAVQEDHLSPNDRQRYNYFFLEGARQAGGSGLGLSIVHDLVSRNFGAIDVKTVIGQGTCFTVTFPYFETEGLDDER